MTLKVRCAAAFGAISFAAIGLFAAVGLMAAPAAGADVAAAATTAAVPVQATPWRVVYKTRTGQPSFRDIVALSSRSIWAVGDRRTGPFVARWNGLSWKTAAIPHPAGFNPQFIRAPAPTDVWVLGYEPDGRAAAVHWDGAAWHTVTLPADASAVGAVLSPSDIWLAGSSVCVSTGCVTTLLHWDGSAWTRSSVHTAVADIRGTSDRDLWLIGRNNIRQAGSQEHSELVGFRWNGTSWRWVSMTHPEITGGPSLVVASPNNVWIGAARARPRLGGEQPMLGVHWNGVRWTVLTAPGNLGSGLIATDGNGGLWFGPDLHWTGRGWIEEAGVWLPSWANPFGYVSMSHVPGTRTDVVAVVSPGGTLIGANQRLR
jgi:hypothetical protein